MRTSTIRRLASAALLLAAAACGDGTGPETTYVLHTVNGALPPVPLYPGSVLLIEGATLTLGPGNRAVSVVDLGCVSPLPPETTCVAPPGGARLEGTYDEDEGTVTYDGNTFNATFAANEVVIWFDGGGLIGESQVWVFRR